ncbi:MAG: hypothetical protein ACOYIF_12875, partial [Acetivibrionales bacterium]
MYQTYRKKKRRFNPRKFIIFLILVSTLITVIIFTVKGKGLLSQGNLNTQVKSDPTENGGISYAPTSDPTAESTPEPTPWPTPEPIPEESTDRAVLDVSWEDPAVFTGPYAFEDYKKTFIKKD